MKAKTSPFGLKNHFFHAQPFLVKRSGTVFLLFDVCNNEVM